MYGTDERFTYPNGHDPSPKVTRLRSAKLIRLSSEEKSRQVCSMADVVAMPLPWSSSSLANEHMIKERERERETAEDETTPRRR
jgi:hypothetical protein